VLTSAAHRLVTQAALGGWSFDSVGNGFTSRYAEQERLRWTAYLQQQVSTAAVPCCTIRCICALVQTCGFANHACVLTPCLLAPAGHIGGRTGHLRRRNARHGDPDSFHQTCVQVDHTTSIPPADAALLRIEEYVAVQPLKAVTGDWLRTEWVKQQQQRAPLQLLLLRRQSARVLKMDWSPGKDFNLL